jgi:arsenate reductase (glutaredoxin)
MITILHNPRCSKSREALVLTQQFAMEQGLALDVLDYQKTPLTLAQLIVLQKQLNLAASDMLRNSEAEYAALNLAQADEATLLQAMADHPVLLQRPIVIFNGRAMIGRPPERLSALLQNA